MNISLPIVKNLLSGKEIRISGSKSESNRLLVLQQFFPEITIKISRIVTILNFLLGHYLLMRMK